jgi:hypothetical protein
MKTPSFRDVEQLSAFLDGKLSGKQRARLESRLRAEPALASVLEELRQTRAALRRMPRRRVPRNFTLTPAMAGLKPPVPRLVPALSWASAAAMLLFVCTLATGLVGQFSFGAGAPMQSAAPRGMGGGSDTASQEYGVGGGPEASEAPAAPDALPQPTPTHGEFNSMAPAPTLGVTQLEPGEPAAAQPASPKAGFRPIDLWLVFWPALALVLIAAAGLVRWLNRRAFRRKLRK